MKLNFFGITFSIYLPREKKMLFLSVGFNQDMFKKHVLHVWKFSGLKCNDQLLEFLSSALWFLSSSISFQEKRGKCHDMLIIISFTDKNVLLN